MSSEFESNFKPLSNQLAGFLVIVLQLRLQRLDVTPDFFPHPAVVLLVDQPLGHIFVQPVLFVQKGIEAFLGFAVLTLHLFLGLQLLIVDLERHHIRDRWRQRKVPDDALELFPKMTLRDIHLRNAQPLVDPFAVGAVVIVIFAGGAVALVHLLFRVVDDLAAALGNRARQKTAERPERHGLVGGAPHLPLGEFDPARRDEQLVMTNVHFAVPLEGPAVKRMKQDFFDGTLVELVLRIPKLFLELVADLARNPLIRTLLNRPQLEDSVNNPLGVLVDDDSRFLASVLSDRAVADVLIPNRSTPRIPALFCFRVHALFHFAGGVQGHVLADRCHHVVSEDVRRTATLVHDPAVFVIVDDELPQHDEELHLLTVREVAGQTVGLLDHQVDRMAFRLAFDKVFQEVHHVVELVPLADLAPGLHEAEQLDDLERLLLAVFKAELLLRVQRIAVLLLRVRDTAEDHCQ